MNTEYKRLEKFIDKLKLSGKIRLAKSDFRFFTESVNKILLTKIQEIIIAPSIINFYKEIDFISLQWYLKTNAGLKFMDEDLDFVMGSLNIPTFTSLVESIMTRNSKSIIDPFHNLNDKDYKALENYFPFEVLNGNGAVCFKLNNGIV